MAVDILAFYLLVGLDVNRSYFPMHRHLLFLVSEVTLARILILKVVDGALGNCDILTDNLIIRIVGKEVISVVLPVVPNQYLL